MYQSTVVLLSIFFVFTAAQTTAVPGVNSQHLMDLFNLHSNSIAPNTAGTNTNNPASLTELMSPASSTTSGSSSGTSGTGQSNLLNNPFLLLSTMGDMSKKLAMMMSLAGQPMATSPASQFALLRGGFGDFLKTVWADMMIKLLSQSSNLSPAMLSFMMRERLPDGYPLMNLLFNNPAFGGMGSGSGSEAGMSNSLLPAMFMGDMAN